MRAHTDPRICRTMPAELAECGACGSITINPIEDTCACGVEFYPIARSVSPGSRIAGVQTALGRVAITLEDVEPPPGKPYVAFDRKQESLHRVEVDVDAATVLEALPELEHLAAEDLDALEAAAVLVVRLRFVARRRQLAAARRERDGATS
jgi:hypothetical protein